MAHALEGKKHPEKISGCLNYDPNYWQCAIASSAPPAASSSPRASSAWAVVSPEGARAGCLAEPQVAGHFAPVVASRDARSAPGDCSAEPLGDDSIRADLESPPAD